MRLELTFAYHAHWMIEPFSDQKNAYGMGLCERLFEPKTEMQAIASNGPLVPTFQQGFAIRSEVFFSSLHFAFL
jgi:hypothetical protein